MPVLAPSRLCNTFLVSVWFNLTSYGSHNPSPPGTQDHVSLSPWRTGSRNPCPPGAQDPDSFTASVEADQQELRDKLVAATARLKQVRNSKTLNPAALNP